MAADASNVSTEPEYRIWVNEARTVLVTLWKSGVVEVARRETPAHIWGPPVICDEEKA